MALEVADDAVNAQTGILVGERSRALAHHALGSVHRYVAVQRPGCLQSVQEHARLRRGARAELDELDRPRQRRDLLGADLQDRALGARGGVLGKLADAVEQLCAAGVVEMLGRQLLERTGEPVESVVRQRAFVRAVEVRVDADGSLEDGLAWSAWLHQRSLARRAPAKICLRWGRSQLRNVSIATRGCVAHEPPRRTR